MKKTVTYQDAGVNIEKGNEFIEEIKPYVEDTNRTGIMGSIGGFGGLFDLAKLNYKDPILVSATDGVGTKLKIANQLNKHNTIGIDLVAMCVNDLVVQGAEPLFFLDYIATGSLDVRQLKNVVKGIADGCKQSGCALIGGETAEMPSMYKKGEYDVAGFAVGIVEREDILPKNSIEKGDIIIGLSSSGLHSNGYSLVRKIYDENIKEEFLEPTKIYVKTCLSLHRKKLVKAFAHITGGGLTENIPRILPKGLSANINSNAWKVPDLFKEIKEKANLDESEMMRTFNCGVGMIAVIAPNKLLEVEELLKKQNEDYSVIGEVI